MTRIPGTLGTRELALLAGADIDARARQHRPTDPAALRVVALELRQRGLTDRDIASALRISEAAVRALLNGAPCNSTDPRGAGHGTDPNHLRT